MWGEAPWGLPLLPAPLTHPLAQPPGWAKGDGLGGGGGAAAAPQTRGVWERELPKKPNPKLT